MVGKTLRFQNLFEQRADQFGVNFKGFLSDNIPFGSSKFIHNVKDKNQTLYFPGTGAHHQNVVTEQAIHNITCWYCAMLFREISMWPDTANSELRPFALEHAA